MSTGGQAATRFRGTIPFVKLREFWLITQWTKTEGENKSEQQGLAQLLCDKAKWTAKTSMWKITNWTLQ